MGLEVAKPGERFVTTGAREGFQAGMGEKVGLQVAASAESLVAVNTLVRFHT